MIYSKSTQLKEALAKNYLSKFTDVVGGNPYELVDVLHGKYTVDDFAYHDDMYYWGVMGYFEKVVIPHKIAVHNAGIDLARQPWFKNYLGEQAKEQFIYNLWVHDLSKFSANEAFGYAMYDRKTGHGKDGFEQAWHHHKMNNPHHPEYWFNPNRSGELDQLPMEIIYAMEMIADWIGAGKTYGSSLEKWIPENLPKFKFGLSKSLIRNILKDVGIKTLISEDNRLIVNTDEVVEDI